MSGVAVPSLSVFLVSGNERIKGVLPLLLKRSGVLSYGGSASTVPEALEHVRASRVDLVVSDLPPRNADEIARWHEVRETGTNLLMLTQYLRERDVVLSILAGASGHILVGGERHHLIDAIVRTSRGESLMPAELMTRLQAIGSGEVPSRLSSRQTQLLQMLMSGKTNPEIVAELGDDGLRLAYAIEGLVAALT